MNEPDTDERRLEIENQYLESHEGSTAEQATRYGKAVLSVEKLAPKSLADIRNLDTQRTWYWDGLATIGIFLIVGKKACYKSWIALWISFHISQGLPFLGKTVKRAACLYYAGELDAIAMAERAKKLPIVNGTLDVIFSLPRGHAALEMLESLMIANGYGVIVLDMLPAILPADSDGNGYTETNVFMLALRRLAQKYSACFICLMHAGKAERVDYVDSVIGSTAYAGQADTVAVLSRKRKESIIQLSASGNHGKDSFLTINVNDNMTLELGDDSEIESAGLSADAMRMVLLMKENYPQGTSPAILSAVIGKPAENIRQSLLRLIDKQIVEKTGRGTYRVITQQDQEPLPF